MQQTYRVETPRDPSVSSALSGRQEGVSLPRVPLRSTRGYSPVPQRGTEALRQFIIGFFCDVQRISLSWSQHTSQPIPLATRHTLTTHAPAHFTTHLAP